MSHLTPVYGDKAVFEEAQKKGIPAKGYFYDYGHSYPERYKSTIFKNANDFIRSYLDCGAARNARFRRLNSLSFRQVADSVEQRGIFIRFSQIFISA